MNEESKRYLEWEAEQEYWNEKFQIEQDLKNQGFHK